MAYRGRAFSGELTLEALRRYVEEELDAIARDQAETSELELRPVYAEPAKPREGMIVFADGTSWNPGGGQGVYVYATGAWVKL